MTGPIRLLVGLGALARITAGVCLACPSAATTGPYCPRCTAQAQEDAPAGLAETTQVWQRVRDGER